MQPQEMNSRSNVSESGHPGSRRAAGNLPLSFGAQLRGDMQFYRLLKLGVITGEFALIVAAIRITNIETEAFELVTMVALGGFLVHHFFPAAWRLNFFAALSVATVPLVFGWENGAWLLGMGALLIALCHLPISFGARIALILLVTIAMAAARKQVLPWVSPHIPAAIWPILAAMFMFRLIAYLYDLKHGAGPFSVGRAASYFFMLPNVCFPLFPVIDYKTLLRSSYNADSLLLYQTGLKWMIRGLLHLALYKLVYFVGVIEPSEATNGMDAARYMIATYLLYLKISGLFHLIVGILHMYGFGLAETHHLYFFSSSFTDFWRRINIYWKDFIQKVVFNPVHFSLRGRLGETGALSAATLIAFSATWFFHSYQWFWIRGDFPIVWSDLVFWFGLGIVVLINVLMESKKGRRRSLSEAAWTLRDSALHGLKIAGTFTAICVLWTIWSTPEVVELEFIWQALLKSRPVDLAILLGVPAGVGLLGAMIGKRKRDASGASAASDDSPWAFWRQASFVSLVAIVFIAVALKPNVLVPVSPDLAMLVKDMRERRLNTADSKKLQRGYYEDLGDVTRFNNELWIMYGGRPKDWNESPQSRERPDGIAVEFTPSTVEVFKGALRTINSHGLRDREYTLLPEPDTFRIALVGASHDMGAGVKDDETYENLVEDRLNRELGPLTGKKFEILNFSHGGYAPTQKLAVIEQRVFQFKPDLILYVAHSHELEWMFKTLEHLVKYKILDQFPFMANAMSRAGIKIGDGESLPAKIVLESKLAPLSEETFRLLLERFRDQALSRRIRPAVALLEIPDDSQSRARIFDKLLTISQSAGVSVLDMQGSFSSVKNRNSLWIAPWDSHTNAAGHRLLADRLYTLLTKEGLVPHAAAPTPADSSGVR